LPAFDQGLRIRVTAPALELRKTALNDLHRAMAAAWLNSADGTCRYSIQPAQWPNTCERARRWPVRRFAYGRDRRTWCGRDSIRESPGSNDVTKLIDGQAQYSALTTPEGTVIDDLLVYRFSEDRLLLVVNAGTRTKIGIGSNRITN